MNYSAQQVIANCMRRRLAELDLKLIKMYWLNSVQVFNFFQNKQH